MPTLDRDKIWWAAWAAIPVAVILNLVVGWSYENATRLMYQADADARDGNWVGAAQRFVGAAELSPQSASLAHNASVAFLKQGKLPSARLWNRRALKIDPEFEPAREVAKEIRRRRAKARPKRKAAGEAPKPPAAAPRPAG